MKPLTVGEVARRTGLSVRSLHHYEAMGLLQPAARSAAGYRLYGEPELRRLQHLVSLKSLGLSLEQIRTSLDRPAASLGEALVAQLLRLRASVAHQQELLARLEVLAQRVARDEAVDVDTLLSTIEASTIMEKYLSSEQQAAVRLRAEQLGPERIRAAEQAWPQVIAGMAAAMQLGKDPAATEVRPLARKWRSLVHEFTCGDAGIQQSLNTLYRQEAGTMQARTGIAPALMDYACRAIAALPKA